MVILEIEDEPESKIKKWLVQLQTFRNPVPIVKSKVIGETEIEVQIREAAYYLSLKHLSYEDLCWSLAEKIQEKSTLIPTMEDIRTTAEEISRSSKKYDELCWLNAELEISTDK